MPLKKEKFSIVQDNMAEAIDVDDSRGRSVPINMNFIETGYLSKDTGFSLSGATETTEIHSIYNFKRKSGTSYRIRAMGTYIQLYNSTTGLWANTSKTITAGAKFGYITDSAGDIMYASNGTDTVWSYDGTTFTDCASIPKGTILEIFEDKLYVAGVTAEPRTIYYSNSGVLTTFTGTDVIKPLGTDAITGLKNYYGALLVFKENSIWKITRVQDVGGTYYNKQDLQSNTYGACSRFAIAWVENDLWFFTGREVRAFGFKDQQTGVLGINDSVISESIKETLLTISESNFPYVHVHYHNRRFYLSVSLNSNTPTLNDTTFVCHTLYKNSWTKYTGRDKAKCSGYLSIGDTIYTIKNVTPYVVLEWDPTLLDDNSTAISGTVTFKKVEDADFNLFNIYRYLDLMFKDLSAKLTVTIYQDKSDVRTSKTKVFYIGLTEEDELGSLGETDFGQSLVADSFGQEVLTSPFIKRRVSFLSKAQSLTIQISNAELSETFTIAQFALYGSKEAKHTFSPGGIVSVR
jgi:hypothetical protein